MLEAGLPPRGGVGPGAPRWTRRWRGALPFAWTDELGYLTACPTNVGTGMRASVLVHLPALVLTQRIKKILAGVTQVGLTVRGFHGEGTEVVGNFFQISQPGDPGG